MLAFLNDPFIGNTSDFARLLLQIQIVVTVACCVWVVWHICFVLVFGLGCVSEA